jgi:hypothetical protein
MKPIYHYSTVSEALDELKIGVTIIISSGKTLLRIQLNVKHVYDTKEILVQAIQL